MSESKAIQIRLPKTLLGCLVLSVAGLTLCLALPRSIASFYALHPATILKETKRLPDETYLSALADIDAALAWHEDPDYWHDRAKLLLRHLKSPELSAEEKRATVDQAIKATEQGLRLSPVDPFAWQRLAFLRQAISLSAKEVIAAFKLSIYAGRVEPELAVSRLDLGFDLLPSMDTEAQELWLKQFPIAYQFQFNDLVQWSVKHPESKSYIEQSLQLSPEKLDIYNKAYTIAYQAAQRPVRPYAR